MSASCEDETLQNQAENFWQWLAPELPFGLLTRLAFNFGAVRRVTATDQKRKLAAEINAALGREAFHETTFGDLVFSE
jgi:hypothetical protein